MFLFAFATLLNVLSVTSIPGLSPTNYCDDELIGGCTSTIEVYAGRLSSPILFGPSLPPQLDQCVTDSPTYSPANLGAKIFGEMLAETNIKMRFKKSGECVELCRKIYNPQDISIMETYAKLLHGIRHSYNRYWVSDNIPVIACKRTLHGNVCEKSFPLGCYKADSQIEPAQCKALLADSQGGTLYLFNHFAFNITYTAAEPSKYNLIAVQVTPMSIAHDVTNLKCPTDQPLKLPDELNAPLTVVYTYSVNFAEVRDAPLSSRWNYLISEAPHESIQWVSIINSVLVVFFLTILVAIVLVRTLRRDFLRYDKMESEVMLCQMYTTQASCLSYYFTYTAFIIMTSAKTSPNETQEEFGWKLVHGDVFRAPRYPMLFAVLVGSGVQMALMSVITLFFGCFGILSPIHRGAFATCAIAVFVCLGASAGYTSARLYKFFNGLCWKTNILMTGLFCPGLVMSVFLVINFVLICLNSSAAVSFTTILSILSMWLLVSLPLCFIGAFFGFRQQVIRVPTRTNQIPRQVPPQACYTRTLPAMLLTGLLPFGCIFVQLFFIFNSIWGQQLFFMFGFLFLVFVFFLACIIEITILTCYFQLCAEDYRWWWRSFLSGGSTAIYVLGYAVNYYLFKTQYKGFISGFLYLTCTTLVSGLLFIMLGSVGFLSCFVFTRIIYRVVKVD